MVPSSHLPAMPEPDITGPRVRAQILHDPSVGDMAQTLPMSRLRSRSHVPTDTILQGILAFMVDHSPQPHKHDKNQPVASRGSEPAIAAILVEGLSTSFRPRR